MAYPVLTFLIVAATRGLTALSVDAGYQRLVISTLIVGVTLFMLLAVTSRTLNAIYRSAVHLFAEKGEVAPPFDRSMIHQAFEAKR